MVLWVRWVRYTSRSFIDKNTVILLFTRYTQKQDRPIYTILLGFFLPFLTNSPVKYKIIAQLLESFKRLSILFETEKVISNFLELIWDKKLNG